MTALALTDHGNLFGALEFYQKAKDRGIKPIVGYEAYVAPGSRFQREAASMKEASCDLLPPLIWKVFIIAHGLTKSFWHSITRASSV